MNATTTTTTPTNPMQFRTLTAKYAGICRRCDGPIAVGDVIRYGGKGKTYHLATDCPLAGKGMPAPQPQAQAAPTAPPTGAQLMTAALAATLQQTWTGLLARPARLGDVEPRVVEAPPVEAEPEPAPVQVVPVATMAGQTPAAKRSKARRKANVALTMAQPLDPDDLF